MHRSELYLSSARLTELLDSLGITVVSETGTDLLCYCPFHYNTDSPALNISKKGPHLFKCWNGGCDKKGNILTLIVLKGYSLDEAKHMLLGNVLDYDELVSLIEELLHEEEEIENEWLDIDVGAFAAEDESYGFPARRYLEDRGVEGRAYQFFRMGYSGKKKMLVIPIFDELSRLAGIVGRSIEYKRYQYSNGLNRNRIVWNLNNARGTGSNYIVLTEGTLDSVYIWQAGVESVGAVFGSSVSKMQFDLIRSYFDEIVCFFDNDDAGRSATKQVMESVKDMQVSTVIYPDGEFKDPGDLSAEVIREMIENRKTYLELMLEGV